jgi:hypothetical protein
MILPYTYLREFLADHPEINSQNFHGAGHERIIKTPEVIEAVTKQISAITTII